MGSINCSGIVRLTRDAEVYTSKYGTFYNFGIAAYRKFAEEGKQDVDFFDAQIFSKNPTPALETNLKKGRLLFIEGANLYNNKFVGKDGAEKSKIMIKVLAWEFFNPSVQTERKEPKPAVAPKVVKREVIEPVDEEIVPVDDEEAPF